MSKKGVGVSSLGWSLSLMGEAALADLMKAPEFSRGVLNAHDESGLGCFAVRMGSYLAQAAPGDIEACSGE